MKKSHFHSGLLVAPLPFSANFVSPSLIPTTADQKKEAGIPLLVQTIKEAKAHGGPCLTDNHKGSGRSDLAKPRLE